MRTITFFGNTDMGQIRSNNEDAFIAQYIWDKKHILAVAIDGVGGYEGGEIAASLAQKSIVEYLESYSNGERLELLKQAVIFANNRIYSERKNLPQYSSMSCVLTAILVETESERINMAHIGDTRLYQYANGEIVKLSHDHSLVGYREEIGELTEEEAMKHPQRNVIGRDVGSQFLESSGNDYVEVETFPLISNSILLLCSDGLCDMITSEQMKIELEKEISVKEKVDNLIKEANKAGGKDNVTVVIVESIDSECLLQNENDIEEEQPLTEVHITETPIGNTLTKSKTKVSTSRICLIILISIFLIMIGYFLGGFTGHRVLPTIFPKNLQIDTIIVEHTDSLVIELRKDTTELHKIIRETESLIDSLQSVKGEYDNAQKSIIVYERAFDGDDSDLAHKIQESKTFKDKAE